MRYLEASNSWTHLGWTGEAVGILFNGTEFLLGVIRKSSGDRQLHNTVAILDANKLLPKMITMVILLCLSYQ